MVVEQKRNDEFKFLINEGMTERLKVADCKSVRFLRRFESYFLQQTGKAGLEPATNGFGNHYSTN